MRQLVAASRKVTMAERVVTYGSKSSLRLTSTSSPFTELGAANMTRSNTTVSKTGVGSISIGGSKAIFWGCSIVTYIAILPVGF